jgi:hypothetical protein
MISFDLKVLSSLPETKTKTKRENRVQRDDALFGERKPVTWDGYEQGSRLPFLEVTNNWMVI